MKRFASLASTVVLAGSLVSAGTVAQANSTLYLVPISELNATYAPGSSVQFAALADIGTSAFSTVNIPTAVAYTKTEFSKPTARTDQSEDPTLPGSGQPFWSSSIAAYSTTHTAINGATLYTIQDTVRHNSLIDQNDIRQTVIPKTYTIATFTFPIASTNHTGSATVYLPTAYGYSRDANTADGYYIDGLGPQFSLLARDINYNNVTDPLTFPNANGKYSSLTFHVGPAAVPEPGALAFLAAGVAGGAILLRKRK